MIAREVRWGELHNIRDLGGLPTPNGETRFGRIFRSPSPDLLNAAGWREMAQHGVVTIVDLRNDYEVVAETVRPAGFVVKRRAIEDQSDREFMEVWGDRLGSPAYYPEVLRRWPRLVARSITAIADAAPGAVLVHCAAGRDRTGMIAAMVLELAGVDRDAIADDYEAGIRETNAWLRLHETREKPRSDDVLDAHLVVARAELNAFLDGMDVTDYLIGAGVTPNQLSGIRSRLLDA